MTINYVGLYYGVRVKLSFNDKYDLANDYYEDIGKLDEELASYGLEARHYPHDLNSAEIVIGKLLGSVDVSEGLPSTEIIAAIRNLNEGEVSDQIKKYFESINYTQEIKTELYSVPDDCHCCS